MLKAALRTGAAFYFNGIGLDDFIFIPNLVRMNREVLGRCAEDLAMSFMLSSGFKLVARNWRSKHKEIDLIFEDDDILRIVEVRCRAWDTLALPAETVGYAKRRNLIRAANDFIREMRVRKNVAFDFISMLYVGNEFYLEYVPDVFSGW